MAFTFDHDLHIHSQLSLCSQHPEQTTERILQYARDNHLKTIALTDHFWDKDVSLVHDWYRQQDYAHISQALPLPQCDGVRFLFGCEADMDKDFTLGVAPQNFDKFDFILVATTHFNNMPTFTISAEDHASLDRQAVVWGERIDRLLSKPLPFHKMGIAHPTCTLVGHGTRESYLEVLKRLSDEVMEHVFSKAATCGIGIELNRDDMNFPDEEADIVLRPYRIAKRCGCKFFFGSDAHIPDTFAIAGPIFERAAALLELTEEDKFNFAAL